MEVSGRLKGKDAQRDGATGDGPHGAIRCVPAGDWAAAGKGSLRRRRTPGTHRSHELLGGGLQKVCEPLKSAQIKKKKRVHRLEAHMCVFSTHKHFHQF